MCPPFVLRDDVARVVREERLGPSPPLDPARLLLSQAAIHPGELATMGYLGEREPLAGLLDLDLDEHIETFATYQKVYLAIRPGETLHRKSVSHQIADDVRLVRISPARLRVPSHAIT
jgi:hypothetical protein